MGRSEACVLRLDDPRVSGEHASIYHRNGAWWVRDLASTNGTTLNEERVRPGHAAALRVGDRLGFGTRNGTRWVLADDRAPGPRAVQGGRVIEADGASSMLAVPSPDEPSLTVYRDNGLWVAEVAENDEVFNALDQMSVQVGDEAWTLELPPIDAHVDEPGTTVDLTTTRLRSVAAVRLRCEHSRDEEFVRITAYLGPEEQVLDERAFHYMILVLARARLADAERPDLSREEQGWVYAEELAKGLGISRAKLNVDIFRARKQFEALGIGDAARIIQRRPPTQQLRIGVDDIEIERL